jgi:predicted acyltransferase
MPDETAPATLPAPAARLAALDLFRGATVAAMLFVNNPGDWGHILGPFGHAEWHGWTVTDLIFPFFLFIVGTSGVLSLEKRRAAGAGDLDLARHAAVRGMTIVLVGWAMAWYPFGLDRLQRLRIPGVLPRIGVVYVLGTCLVLLFRRRRAWMVLTAAAVLVAAHTFLLTGLGFDLTREGNVQRFVDLALLKGHLWKKDWDPEGIVSTLSATATMLTGTLAGFWLKSDRPLGRKVTGLVLLGLLAVAAGEFWGQSMPVNKNLWTGSYVLLSSGFAAASLGLSILLVDGMGLLRPPGFLYTFGTNPMLAFVLSGLGAKTLGLVKVAGAAGPVSLHQFLFRGSLGRLSNPVLASHLWALAVIVVWYLVLRVCERRGWYWKV